MSEPVTVTGTPTLTLNDGGTATYVSGSGSSTLTFSYTVASGQDTWVGGDGRQRDGRGLRRQYAEHCQPGGDFAGVIIDTTTPSVSLVGASGTGITAGAGDLGTGKVVTLTVNLSEVGDGCGGSPTLTLNDGGIATYTGGSGSNALTFSYTVGAGQNTADLAVTAVNLGTATVKDGAGNAADFSGAIRTRSAFCRSTPPRLRWLKLWPPQAVEK